MESCHFHAFGNVIAALVRFEHFEPRVAEPAFSCELSGRSECRNSMRKTLHRLLKLCSDGPVYNDRR